MLCVIWCCGNVCCMYVCVYVRMYVRTYICMYVCVGPGGVVVWVLGS